MIERSADTAPVRLAEQAVLSFAWQQRCYKVMLLTGRPEVVGFYQQVGFQTEGKIGLIAKPPKEGRR